MSCWLIMGVEPSTVPWSNATMQQPGAIMTLEAIYTPTVAPFIEVLFEIDELLPIDTFPNISTFL